MTALRLGLQLLQRDLRAGELRVLLAALVLAVCSVSSVGFITDRASGALRLRANALLGGDAVLRADQTIDRSVRERADALGLAHTETRTFPSMARVGDRFQLSEIKAMDSGFPLRGQFLLQGPEQGGTVSATSVPGSGEAWVDAAGASRLGARLGDEVQLGQSTFRIVALVAQEPDAALDYFNVAPRVFIHLADLGATGLEQPGSRITHRVVVAGSPSSVRRWTADTREALGRGQRIETADDARPEMRNAIRRADRFLALSALVSVVVAGLALAMAARRHARRHLDACAVMRCLGASQNTLFRIYVVELLGVAVVATAIGLALAWLIQFSVVAWLGQALRLDLPPASIAPVGFGAGVALVMLVAFALPPIMQLRRVPTMRVLRRDLGAPPLRSWIAVALGLGGCGLLMVSRTDSLNVGLGMLIAIAASLLALALVGGTIVLALRRVRGGLVGGWRHGVAVLARKHSGSVVQISALGLGLMVLMLLALLRGDLLERWRALMPADLPNRFLVNVQSDQVADVERMLQDGGVTDVALVPMVRARWVERNGEPFDRDAYNGRARRLAEREFNLSWADRLSQSDNRVVAGEFWSPESTASELSAERGLAEALGWKLGDRIVFDVAGSRVEGELTSIREVDWERFRPNFFVLFSPAALQRFPASHIGAFNVSPERAALTDQVVRAFPNVTVIDIDAIVRQVRSVAEQASMAVQAVFLFTFGAGLLVLVAAVGATQDERLREGSVMRALGASRGQLRAMHLAEFVLLGLIASMTAALCAAFVATWFGEAVLDLPWVADPPTLLAYAVAGSATIAAVGMLMTRGIARVPPALALRALSD